MVKKGGILTGLLGLNGAAYLGVPEAAIVTGLAASGVALVMEKVAQLKEQGELQDKKGYFLWKHPRCIEIDTGAKANFRNNSNVNSSI